MLLVGDIGGTKTLLGFCEPLTPRPIIHHVQRFSTLDYHSLEDLLSVFLRTSSNVLTLEAAILGVAGPVRNNASALTNVPWHVDASQLSKEFWIPEVYVLNDLVAMDTQFQCCQATNFLSCMPDVQIPMETMR